MTAFDCELAITHHQHRTHMHMAMNLEPMPVSSPTRSGDRKRVVRAKSAGVIRQPPRGRSGNPTMEQTSSRGGSGRSSGRTWSSLGAMNISSPSPARSQRLKSASYANAKNSKKAPHFVAPLTRETGSESKRAHRRSRSSGTSISMEKLAQNNARLSPTKSRIKHLLDDTETSHSCDELDTSPSPRCRSPSLPRQSRSSSMSPTHSPIRSPMYSPNSLRANARRSLDSEFSNKKVVQVHSLPSIERKLRKHRKSPQNVRRSATGKILSPLSSCESAPAITVPEGFDGADDGSRSASPEDMEKRVCFRLPGKSKPIVFPGSNRTEDRDVWRKQNMAIQLRRNTCFETETDYELERPMQLQSILKKLREEKENSEVFTEREAQVNDLEDARVRALALQYDLNDDTCFD